MEMRWKIIKELKPSYKVTWTKNQGETCDQKGKSNFLEGTMSFTRANHIFLGGQIELRGDSPIGGL